MHCAQILGEALADGQELGMLACPGNAADRWNALSTCVMNTCDAGCSIVMPTTACAECLNAADTDGGCATEAMTCLAN
jgi:hypothetical protein